MNPACLNRHAYMNKWRREQIECVCLWGDYDKKKKFLVMVMCNFAERGGGGLVL